MHQISFFFVIFPLTPSNSHSIYLNSISLYMAACSTLIFEIPCALHFNKLTLSEKYCLFFPSCVELIVIDMPTVITCAFFIIRLPASSTDRFIVCNMKCCSISSLDYENYYFDFHSNDEKCDFFSVTFPISFSRTHIQSHTHRLSTSCLLMIRWNLNVLIPALLLENPSFLYIEMLFKKSNSSSRLHSHSHYHRLIINRQTNSPNDFGWVANSINVFRHERVIG